MFATKRAVVTALLLATAGLSSACGEDAPSPADGSASEKKAAPSASKVPEAVEEQAIVALVKKFQVAVDKGDGKAACALLTSELQGVYAQDPGAGSCPAAISNLNKALGKAKLSSIKIAPEDVDIVKKDKEAVISHELIAKRNKMDSDATESFNLEKRKGAWLISYVG